MKVTDLDYALETKLLLKLDYFCQMVTRENQKQDVVLIVHGKTGDGKTNTSLLLGYYFKCKLGRPIHLFFKRDPMIEFAKKTTGQIIIWDEPALDSLSTDQLTRRNKDLMRLLHTMRRKRHILIVNITRFWRFPEDLIVERALGLINMYTRDGKVPGRFQYIRQRNLEMLWNTFQSTGRRLYNKLKSFGGQMPEVIEKVDEKGMRYFDKMDITVENKPHATLDDYEELKDAATASIGEPETLSKSQIRDIKSLRKLRFNLANGIVKTCQKFNLSKEQVLPCFEITSARLYEWLNIDLNEPLSLGKVDFEGSNPHHIINTMVDNQENAVQVGDRGGITPPIDTL